jgi:hypothetical protein
MISRSKKKTNERTKKSGVIHTQTRPGEKKREPRSGWTRSSDGELFFRHYHVLSSSSSSSFTYFYISLGITMKEGVGEKKIRMSQKNSNQFFFFFLSPFRFIPCVPKPNERTNGRKREREKRVHRPEKSLRRFFLFSFFHVLLHIRPTFRLVFLRFAFRVCVCMCGPVLDWLHEKCFPFSPQKTKQNKTKLVLFFFSFYGLTKNKRS